MIKNQNISLNFILKVTIVVAFFGLVFFYLLGPDGKYNVLHNKVDQIKADEQEKRNQENLEINADVSM